MLKLIIEDDEGRKTVVPFVRDEITIGRQEGNTIRLTERNVSRRHARLVRLNGHVVVEDLGSYNGTRINGERIAGQSPLKEGDLIQIGDYDLALQSEGAANVAGPITTKVPSAFAPTSPSSPALRRTEPAMDSLGEPEPEQDYPASAGAAEQEDDEDGDEHDHTPPPADQRRHSTSIIRLDQVEADRPRKVEDVPAEEAPRLLVLAPDELKGQEFACIRTELRVGRTDDNDITLDHRSLSRTHVKLVREQSGEWRVIDMQSANGLTVNGESYAQATLGSGDIIELGHVKLRFLNAGDAADDLPVSAGGSRSKLPLVAGLAALLLGGGAAAVFFLRSTPTPQPVVVADPEEPRQAPPEPVKPPSGSQPATAETQPSGQTPEVPSGPTLEERMAMARKAMDEGNFDEAEVYLSNAKDAQGRRPDLAAAMLEEVKTERKAGKLLDTARAALDAGRLDEATAALEESKGTQAFQSRHAELMGQLDEARKKAAAAATPPPPENPGSGTPNAAQNTVPAVATASPEETRAKELLAEARKSMKAQPQLAVTRLKECLELVSDHAECHMYLGAAYARTGKPDEGLTHYRRFLKLATPEHPRFEEVKGIVDNYEALKKK